MTVRTELSERRVSRRRLARVARRLLEVAPLCALATVAQGGRAYVNTMYFASNARFDIFWISAPDSHHSRNIRANGRAAVAVYDSRQRWGGRDRGLQVFGRGRELNGRAAAEAGAVYARRFHAGAELLSRYRAYRLRPTRLKLFDEREFGSGAFIVARVGRSGVLTWERTEVYRSS